MQLCEKYRPGVWDEFIGQPKVLRRVRMMLDRPGFGEGGGEAFLITGPSGTGKTTLAQLISRALGVQPGNAWNYLELDGDKCTAEAVRSLDDQTRAASMFSDEWRVIIVNEAHAITSRAVQAWLTLLERLPERWLVVFTTTEPADNKLFGNFSEQMLSRFAVLTFTNQGLAKDMASRAREIAQSEGLDGQPVQRYVRLVQDKHNNFRAVLQAIYAGEMIE